MRAIGALVALFGGVVIAAKLGVLGNGAQPQQPAQATSRSSSVAVPTGQIGPGVWLVGSDVQPGTYRTTGPATGQRYCYWSRHSSTSGGPLNDIIASDGASSGQMIVTIKASDKLFRTNDCAPFVKIG